MKFFLDVQNSCSRSSEGQSGRLLSDRSRVRIASRTITIKKTEHALFYLQKKSDAISLPVLTTGNNKKFLLQ